MEPQRDPAVHWDDAYARGEGSRSWFQQHPALSLQMLDAAGVSAGDSLIDVGGGHHLWLVPSWAAGSGT